MSITGWIIAGLSATLVTVLAGGGLLRGVDRWRSKLKENKIRKEEEEHAQHTAEVITEAAKIKDAANTGNHKHDMGTMSDQLHNYAHRK